MCVDQVTKGRAGGQIERYLYLSPNNKQVGCGRLSASALQGDPT